MDEKMSIMQGVVGSACECDVALFGVAVKSTIMRKRGLTPSKITGHATALLVERLAGFAQERRGETLRVISDNTDERYRLAT